MRKSKQVSCLFFRIRLTWALSLVVVIRKLCRFMNTNYINVVSANLDFCTFNSVRFASAGECLTFEDFVAEIHANAESEDGVYSAHNCSGIGHNDTCALTCGTGFELSNALRSGAFICDTESPPFPGWRREDTIVSTLADALCTPGTMFAEQYRDY